jgi:hypothetical protein
MMRYLTFWCFDQNHSTSEDEMGLPGRGMSNVLCVNIWLSLTKLLAFLMSDIYEK